MFPADLSHEALAKSNLANYTTEIPLRKSARSDFAKAFVGQVSGKQTRNHIHTMNTAYIIDILRTPIGKYGGTLASVRPDDLAAHVIKKLLERNPTIDLNKIEDVVFG